MQYRTMPQSDTQLSILGFGCMRFETNADGTIIEDKAMAMLQQAYEQGVNYFDTAWPYHNEASEPLLGRFLQTIDRSSVYVATKLPSWLIKEPADMDAYLEKQLQRLQTDYIDYYLVHALNKNFWKNLKAQKLFTFLDAALADGRIRKVGFSFHDGYPLFKKIVDAYKWDFCQIMLNYLDTHYQGGLAAMRYAAAKAMGIVVMEPLRGGKLVNKIPMEVQALWDKSPHLQNPVQRALLWLWDMPEVQVILSGMSNMQQLQENLDIADTAGMNSISPTEQKRYKAVRKAYLKRIAIHCSECRYCLPCPSGLPIPTIFGMYNEMKMFDNPEANRKEYNLWVPVAVQADKCTSCGACISKCPRGLDIPTLMKTIADHYGTQQ